MTWSDNRDRIQARVIRDSINPLEKRLTTLEVTMHRFVLAEFNTHRTFSRNSESSRAVPFHKRLEKVRNHPAVPVSFPQEQRGMSGGDEVANVERARSRWIKAAEAAAFDAETLAQEGVHKSVVNRMLEPYMWHTVVVTATEWDGFFHQRCHEAAQPEIRLAAEAMQEALESSEPDFVNYGEWHLPFINQDDLEELGVHPDWPGYKRNIEQLKQISAARCARTSYLTHDGHRSLEKDLELYQRLAVRDEGSNDPHHWSPLEHVATPCRICETGHKHTIHPGNFKGWYQHRHELDASPYC